MTFTEGELSGALLGESHLRPLSQSGRMLCEYSTVTSSAADSLGGGSRTAWLRPRLCPPEDFVVGSWIPSGFEAYARILHPVQEGPGESLIRWAEVACWSGVALVPSIQWYQVALPEFAPKAEPPWTSQGPREGTLSHADTIELVDILSRHSSGLCLFGVWEGYGFDLVVECTEATSLPHRVEESPFELPWRSYALFEGPVTGAACFHTSQFQSPNLWWPQDRSWCVASEIDLPWTYVAGSQGLINQLLASPHLEVLEAAPGDRIGAELPPWLETRISAAVEDVIVTGSTELDFGAGIVTATLVRLSRRKSVLVARSERGSGWGARNVPIDTRLPEVMRREIGSAIKQAVIGLVSV